MQRRGLLALVAIMALSAMGALASAAQAETKNMDVYGTSDISDSALMVEKIAPGFEAYSAAHGSTTYQITYHSSGTGQALKEAAEEKNHASAVLVHAISLERKWVEEKHSFYPNEWGYALFYNDFVILGPTGDPAEVGKAGEASKTEAKAAFKKIALAGNASPTKATFVSRGDESGTNIKEQEVWSEVKGELEAAGIAMTEITASRAKPTPASNPWYKETNAKQGANLEITNECNKAGWTAKTCYTIVDRGSYYNLKSKGKTGNLTVVTQEPSPPTGELTNVFRGYIPQYTPDVAASELLFAYLQSEGFQDELAGFISSSEQSFVANAAPHLRSSIVPELAETNKTIEIKATLDYAPPIPSAGSHPLFKENVEAELRVQENCSGSFVGTGVKIKTNASGTVVFKPKFKSASEECYEVETFPVTVSESPFESQFAGTIYRKGLEHEGRVEAL